MNIGQCPYDCGATIVMEVPAVTPVYTLTSCPNCLRLVWYRLSRIDPMAWTEEEFLLTHKVDHELRIIKEKERQNAIS